MVASSNVVCFLGLVSAKLICDQYFWPYKEEMESEVFSYHCFKIGLFFILVPIFTENLTLQYLRVGMAKAAWPENCFFAFKSSLSLQFLCSDGTSVGSL